MSRPSARILSRSTQWSVPALLLLFTIGILSGGMAAAQAITLGATLNIVAGNGTPGSSGDGGLALNAELAGPMNVALDGAGNYYFVDDAGTVVRKVAAKTGIITTVAGNHYRGDSGDGGPATKAELNEIEDIAVDAAGDIYIADGGNYNIRKVDASTGIISTVVSSIPSAIPPYTLGINLAVDGRGDLYFNTGIITSTPSVVYEFSAGTGRVSVVAGNGTSGYSGDGGPATAAELSGYLAGIAVDPAGNLYICDGSNNRIRKVDAATGIITTVVGDGVANNSGDGGQAASAELNSPYAIAFDSAGNLYIAVSVVGATDGSSLIREVSASTGVITTVVGNGKGDGGGLGGSPTSTGLASVTGLAVGTPGDIYLTEGVAGVNSFAAEQVLEIVTRRYLNFPSEGVGGGRSLTAPLDVNANGTTITGISAPVSEGGKQEYAIGTPSCTLNAPLSAGSVCNVPITFNPAYPGERLVPLRVATSAGTFNFGMVGLGTGPQVALTPGIVSTVAGNGTQGFSGNGGPATGAEFSSPGPLFLDSAGNLYLSDTGNNQVRMISAATGTVVNVAGSATPGSPALNDPEGIALDAAGNLYIADSSNNVIRERSANTGAFTIVAGNGTQGFSGDGGPATGAQLNRPAGLAVDDEGNLYIADTGNFRIREVAAGTGTITTIAGNGTQGDTGDGGPATQAELYAPVSLALDDEGDLYFSDSSAIGSPGADVREVAAGTGVITTVAGTGNPGYSGDGGPATAAQLNGPSGIAVDSAGDVYIADLGNHAIREVSAKTGIIQTVAGNGVSGSTGDGGPANKAAIVPSSVALDSQGNLYFSNSAQGALSYNTVREVNVSAGLLNFAGTPVGTTSADSPQTATVSNIGNAELGFNLPRSGTNPAISNPSFTLNNGGTCSQLDTTSKPKVLDSGGDCTFLFGFTPATSGAISGTATVSDNALHVASATQAVHLNGTGTGSGTGGGTGTGKAGDFTLTAAPSSETVSSGLTATYTVTASGTNGFAGTVALTATGLPPGMTLNFSQTSVTVSANPANSTLTIATTPSNAQIAPGDPFPGGGGPESSELLRYGLLLLPLPLFGVVRLRKRLRALRRTSVLTVLIVLLSLGAFAAGLTGCANIGLEPTTESYNLTVTGVSGNLQHSVPLTLNVSTYKEIKY